MRDVFPAHPSANLRSGHGQVIGQPLRGVVAVFGFPSPYGVLCFHACTVARHFFIVNTHFSLAVLQYIGQGVLMETGAALDGVTEMTMNAYANYTATTAAIIDRETALWVRAYLMGNERATAGESGAWQIADDLGFERDSMEWNAAVSGAAAYFFSGRSFETKSDSIVL